MACKAAGDDKAKGDLELEESIIYWSCSAMTEWIYEVRSKMSIVVEKNEC